MKSLFGLPKKVIHCKKCLLTNQKPFSINETTNKIKSKKKGLKFNNKKVCAACQYSEKKNNGTIDWKKKEKLLEKLLDNFRKKDGGYDCIVSGSGGKDSSTVAHILKYKYNMNPLTVTYSPLIYTEVGFKNLRSWINVGGFDNFLFTPNGKLSSILAKEAFTNLLHPVQPFKFGIKTIAAKMALKFNIKLVMFGEPYAEYGSEDDNSFNSRPSYDVNWYINDSKDIFFGGIHYKDLLKKYEFIKENELAPFMPLTSNDIKKSKLKSLKVEYLGWYIKWDSQEAYYYASENCGYFPDTQRSDGTYGRYSAIDDKMEWLHYYTHYIKFGIGRARLDACQEIRSGHITRDEGIMLCKKFEGEYPKTYIKDCFDYMNISEIEANRIIDKFRSPHLWKKVGDNWQRLQELKEIIK